jgi:hypothetical protein
MITKDSIEQTYSFFHQKYRVYKFSNSLQQKDDIELAINSFVECMNTDLYKLLSHGNNDFLLNHSTFAVDIKRAIEDLEKML